MKNIEAERGLIRDLLSTEELEKEKAWTFLYRNSYPIVREFIRNNSGEEADATDTFQDAMLVLYRNLNNGSFREESSINTYVFSICKNLWLKELAKRQKRQINAEDLVIDDQDMNYLVNVKVVGLLMNELKHDCREILIQYYFNRKSMAELKDLFNVNSIQAAKNKKMRCLSYLIKLVNEKGNICLE